MKNRTLLFLLLACSTHIVNAQLFTPVHKVVIEDQTISSTGFGIWCPRGIVRIDSFVNSPFAGEAEIISVHSGYGGAEVMADFAYWNDCLVNPNLTINAWPQIMVDRKAVDDPDAIFLLHGQYIDDYAVADIAVDPVYDPVTRELVVTAAAHFGVDVVPSVATYNLALVLTEDSVHGTSVAYSQRNTYSGGANGPMAGGGIDFAAQPDPVPAALMYYRHVARDILGSFLGDDASLPDTLMGDSTYSYTFPTYTVPLPYNASKMRAIVLLIDTASGEIKNANGAPLFDPVSGISQPAIGVLSFNAVPNPFSEGTTLAFTIASAEDVQLRVLDALGRSVVFNDMGSLAAGEHALTIDARGMRPGIYFARLSTGHGSITKRIVLGR